MRRQAIIGALGLLALAGCDGQEASGNRSRVSLQLLDFAYEFTDGRHRYNHRRIFTESAGVAATIVRGKVCVQNGTDCVDALVSYPVEASGRLEQKNHYIATPLEKDRITLHFWVKDNAGNSYEFEKVVVTDGEKATVE